MMKCLILAWAITASYVPMSNDSIKSISGANASTSAPEDTYAIDLSLSAEMLGFVRLRGSAECYMTPTELPYLNPFRQDYGISASLFAGPFEFGVWHECDHFVYSRAYTAWYEKGETQFFMRFSSKVEY